MFPEVGLHSQKSSLRCKLNMCTTVCIRAAPNAMPASRIGLQHLLKSLDQIHDALVILNSQGVSKINQRHRWLSKADVDLGYRHQYFGIVSTVAESFLNMMLDFDHVVT